MRRATSASAAISDAGDSQVLHSLKPRSFRRSLLFCCLSLAVMFTPYRSTDREGDRQGDRQGDRKATLHRNTPAIASECSGGPCVVGASSRSAKRLSDPRAVVNKGLHSIERADARISITCQRLIKPDGSTVGYFTSGLVMRCARHAWAQAGVTLRSVATVLQSSVVEPVDQGDGLRLDIVRCETELGSRCADWLDAGAAEVRVARITINAWVGPSPAREQHLGAVGATFYQLTVIAATT